MSPKWILRHKLATSSLEDLADGHFMPVIPEREVAPDKARRLILCSGKVYYHMLEERMERKIDDIAMVRIEQLYPFPDEDLLNVLSEYTCLEEVVWCQEEPINQGAWYSSQHHMRSVLDQYNAGLTLRYVGRPASAAPAAGYMSAHLEEQARFVNEALSF